MSNKTSKKEVVRYNGIHVVVYSPLSSAPAYVGAKDYDEAIAEIERLRAALEKISQDEFSQEYALSDTDNEDYWRVINLARSTLARLGVETKESR